ncbi:MAG: maleylpyruvate isomerase family protein, partial [Acidimicrobiaceae bacterium]|nr:maleylpyruvate isomerase family protein [Acidimicrobiaceae bacterium]
MIDYSRQSLIDATEACFAEISSLCADLSDEEWTVQSLCPDWTVRQAIGHAVGVEDVISGW